LNEAGLYAGAICFILLRTLIKGRVRFVFPEGLLLSTDLLYPVVNITGSYED
jgi:hypothetical protein